MEPTKKQDKANNPGRTNDEITYARNLWSSGMLEIRGPLINVTERVVQRFNKDIICSHSARINIFQPTTRSWPILDWEVVIGERYRLEAAWLWPCFANDFVGFFITGRMSRCADLIPEYLWYVGEVLECPEFQNAAMMACFRSDGEEFYRLSLQGAPDILKVLEIQPINGTYSYHKLFNYIQDWLIWDTLQGGTKWLGWVNRGGQIAKEVARAQVEAAKLPPPAYPPSHLSNHYKYLHVNHEPEALRFLDVSSQYRVSFSLSVPNSMIWVNDNTYQQPARMEGQPRIIRLKREGSPENLSSKRARIEQQFEEGEIPGDDDRGYVHPSRRAFVSVSSGRQPSADSNSPSRSPLQEMQNNSRRRRRRSKPKAQALKALIEEAQLFNNENQRSAQTGMDKVPNSDKDLLSVPNYTKQEKQAISRNVSTGDLKDWVGNSDIHSFSSEPSGMASPVGVEFNFLSSIGSTANTAPAVLQQRKKKGTNGTSAIVPKGWNAQENPASSNRTVMESSTSKAVNDDVSFAEQHEGMKPDTTATNLNVMNESRLDEDLSKAVQEHNSEAHILGGKELTPLENFPPLVPNSEIRSETVVSVSWPIHWYSNANHQEDFQLLPQTNARSDLTIEDAKDDNFSVDNVSLADPGHVDTMAIGANMSGLVTGCKVKDPQAHIEGSIAILDG